ncbi:hypothetical protein Mapa_017127 [Marchantia paleacea]|nr:hypothetical protein Mapa_017127 [Marchantia paleacea]
MDDDDDDAHLPYHNVHHHLYETTVLHHGANEQENEEDGDEEEDEEDEDEDENIDDDEDEDEGDQEHLEYEQDFQLEHSHKRSVVANANGNGNLRSNATSAPALALYQHEIACPSGRIEGGGGVGGAGPGPGPGPGPAAAAAGGGDKYSGRDDWTEGATHALLEAWGDRYVQLNKGNLKQEDWEEVAEVVSSMSKSHKTDVQCKNRLDTLKKKYKVEKHKQSAIGSLDSKWPFYKRLDQLLSATVKRAGIPGGVDAGVPVKSSLDREDSNRRSGRKHEDEDFRTPNNTSTSSKSKESAEMTFSSPLDEADAPGTDGTQSSRKRKAMDTPFKTLAKAITRFGEIYEKMEYSKQQQLMDLEKIRMEFTRDLELQRMQLFMQTQVELAKVKHGTSEIDPTVSSNLSQ